MQLAIVLVLVGAAPADTVRRVDERGVLQLLTGGDGLPYARLADGVYVFKDGAWKTSQGEQRQPADRLGTSPGGVLTIRSEGPTWTLTEHRGRTARVIAASNLPLPGKLRLHEDARGLTVLSGEDRRFLTVFNGQVEEHFVPAAALSVPYPGFEKARCTLERDPCCGPNTSCGRFETTETPSATYLWATGGDNAFVLAAPVRVSEAGLGAPPKAPATIKRVIRGVAAQGDDVVFTSGPDLYLLEGSSQTVKPLPTIPQVRDANIRPIAALYAGVSRLFAVLERPFQPRTGALFERGGPGFVERVPGLGMNLWQGMELPAGLVTERGAAFAADGLGVWRVDAKGEAVLIDAGVGLKTTEITGLAALPDGSLLVGDAKGGTFLIRAGPAPKR